MTKQTAIRKFCLDCFGGSTKDIALCTAPDCPLWPFRLGYGLKTTRAKAYMKTIAERYPKDVASLKVDYGLDPSVFYPEKTSFTDRGISGTGDLGPKRRKRSVGRDGIVRPEKGQKTPDSRMGEKE